MAWRQITVRFFRAHPLACTPVCIRAHTRVQNGLHIRVQAENAHPSKNEKSPKFPYYKGLSGICTLMRTSHDRSCCGEHIVHIDGVTGSSPVQTTQSSICKGRGFFHIAAEKEGIKHDQVRPSPQAQQESPQRTGRPEAHDMGVFPGDEESREQENLQPQESRSCVEG